MKAAVYYENGGPEVLRYEDIDDPEPAAREVLVEVRAIGIQGGDLLGRARGELSAVPHVVGYQAAGVIAGTGSQVTSFAPGQRVTAFAFAGSHAELFCVPAATVWAIPDELSFEQAAAIPVEYGTAHDCLFEFGHLQPGETVLVQAAASGVGVAAVQLAKAAGARVIGTASSDEKLARLREHGLDVAVNYVTGDPVAEVMAATGGRGADLVVDSVGGKVLQQSIDVLAYRGRISWVGMAGRDGDQPDLQGLMLKNASLTGVFLGAEMGHDPARVYAMVERLIARAASGELPVVIDSTFPLSDAGGAHRHIESRRAFGRVLLIP
jgi:NADPH2:quinone reductase